METVVGLFDQLESARRAVAALRYSGFIDEDIRLISQAHDFLQGMKYPEGSLNAPKKSETKLDTMIASTSQDILGSLANLVLPDKAVEFYTDSFRRGGVLVVLHISDGRSLKAQQIMSDADAVDVQYIYHSFGNNPLIPFGLLQDSKHKIPLSS